MKKRALMKKAAGVVLSVMMAASLLACGNKDEKKSEEVATEQTASAESATAATALPEVTFDAVVLSSDKLTKIGDYKNYTYEAFNPTVSDEEVEKYYVDMVNSYAEAGYTGTEKDDSRDGTAVQSGDNVNIDFTGYMDGEAFEGGTGTDFNLEIGSGSFIPGFEDALIGKNVGETVTIDVTFPEEYPNDPTKAGKDAQFEVKLNYIAKAVDLTVDNAYKVYFKFNTKEELYADLKSYLESQKNEDTYISEQKTAYVNAILDGSEFADISEEAAKSATNLKDMYSKTAAENGVDLSTFIAYYGFSSEDDFNTYIEESSASQLKFELLLSEIAKTEGFVLTDEKYAELASAQATTAGYDSVESYEAEFDSRFGRGAFRNTVTSYYYEDELFNKYAKAE